jgi:hypothetical protein
MKDVIGVDYEMTQELMIKKRNTTLDGFWELLTNCILIYEGAVVVVLLHELVLSDQASEYFATMANIWEFNERVTKTFSPETGMAMFGHRFYYNDCVPVRSLCKLWMYPSNFLSFFPLSKPFSFPIFL